MPNVTFFSVCGGGEEYDFLLGSIEHHARIGNHLVLDVAQEQKEFVRLPGSVSWFRDREGAYQSGDWKTFRLATALEDARKLAIACFPGTEFLVHLDCDEYYDVEVLKKLFVRQDPPRTLVFETIHWHNGRALRFGPGERHRRAWDVRADVQVIKNTAWMENPAYNGNLEHHPLLSPKAESYQEIHVPDPIHYHLHYALGAKQFFLETAHATIGGWPNGTPIESPCPWPEPHRKWAETGEKPSVRFIS